MPYQKDALKNLDKTKQGPQLKKHHNGTYLRRFKCRSRSSAESKLMQKLEKV